MSELTTDETHRYAFVYWHYGTQQVSFGATLDELVAESMSGEDVGTLSSGGFYELTPDGWAGRQDDAVALREKKRAAEEAEWQRERATAAARRWAVYLVGPSEAKPVLVCESLHETEAEARAAAATYPAGLRAFVHGGARRPTEIPESADA